MIILEPEMFLVPIKYDPLGLLLVLLIVTFHLFLGEFPNKPTTCYPPCILPPNCKLVSIRWQYVTDSLVYRAYHSKVRYKPVTVLCSS